VAADRRKNPISNVYPDEAMAVFHFVY